MHDIRLHLYARLSEYLLLGLPRLLLPQGFLALQLHPQTLFLVQAALNARNAVQLLAVGNGELVALAPALNLNVGSI